MINISVHEVKGKKEVYAETKEFCLKIRPWQGAKIYSLISKRTGFEFFFQDPRAGYEKLNSKKNYIKHDITGYDECFPTLETCIYPYNPWKGVQLGDHGWLWNKNWNFEIADNKITTWFKGGSVSFYICRTLSFEKEHTIIFSYLLQSKLKNDFKYIWSAHPSLTLTPYSEILLPHDIESIIYFDTEFSGNHKRKFIWPNIPEKGKVRDISKNLSPANKREMKLFFPALTKGECSLVHHNISEIIHYEFDIKDIPYLGLWINEGCSFGDIESKKSFCVALEPCTGLADTLGKAEKIGKVGFLPAKGKVKWQLRLSIVSI